MQWQQTVRNVVKVQGVGLHSGDSVTLRIRPAKQDTGIRFRRVDLTPVVEIPAHVDYIADTSLATVLGRDGATISTVEHCLAALRGLGVDNAIVEVDGAEVPILDGSSAEYVERIMAVGLKAQRRNRTVLRVVKPIRVECGDKFSILRPADRFAVTYSIDFEQGFPGEQHFFLQISPDSFAAQLSRARTFGFVRDVEMLRSMGKAQGASLDNAVALDDGKVLNPEGLRMPNEMVRHKMLDAVGDLALSGYAIDGHLIVHKGGHELHRQLVVALLARPDAWELVEPGEGFVRHAGRAAAAVAGVTAAHI